MRLTLVPKSGSQSAVIPIPFPHREGWRGGPQRESRDGVGHLGEGGSVSLREPRRGRSGAIMEESNCPTRSCRCRFRPNRLTTSPQCPGCGTSLADLYTDGRMGCARCYETFADIIQRALVVLHGSTRHMGKTPMRIARKQLPALAQAGPGATRASHGLAATRHTPTSSSPLVRGSRETWSVRLFPHAATDEDLAASRQACFRPRRSASQGPVCQVPSPR